MMSLVTGALGILGSAIGRLLLAFAIGWFWSGHRTDAAWQARVAAERAAAEAAYHAEVARQEHAAREIAEAATQRVEEDAALAAELRRQIALAERAEGNAPAAQNPHRVIRDSCRVGRDLVERVRVLDATARKSAPPRRPGDVR